MITETQETPKPCVHHHFGDWGRCAGCQMQTRYYNEGIASLGRWTKEEIKTDYEHYLKVKKNYEECKPHYHKVSTDSSEPKK